MIEAAIGRSEVADYVATVIFVYTILIIANVLLSWIRQFRPLPYNPALRSVLGFVDETTEPYLNVFRSFVPRIGPLDISPIVGILALSIVGALIVGLIRG